MHPHAQQKNELDKDGIRAFFFPPNVTSYTKPTDTELVENLKRRYRKLFLQFINGELDNGEISVQCLKWVVMKKVDY